MDISLNAILSQLQNTKQKYKYKTMNRYTYLTTVFMNNS